MAGGHEAFTGPRQKLLAVGIALTVTTIQEAEVKEMKARSLAGWGSAGSKQIMQRGGRRSRVEEQGRMAEALWQGEACAAYLRL